MNRGDKVIFSQDILNWNNANRRAKKGDTGKIITVFRGMATVQRDGKSNLSHDIPCNCLEVLR